MEFERLYSKPCRKVNTVLELLCWGRTSVLRVNTLLKKPALICISGGYGCSLPVQLAMDKEYLFCLSS